MTVSTATYAWNSGVLVTATGTLAEVMTDMTSNTSYALENKEDFLIEPPFYNGTNITAIWYSTGKWT